MAHDKNTNRSQREKIKRSRRVFFIAEHSIITTEIAASITTSTCVNRQRLTVSPLPSVSFQTSTSST